VRVRGFLGIIDFREQGNEPYGFIKREEILDYPSDCYFQKGLSSEDFVSLWSQLTEWGEFVASNNFHRYIFSLWNSTPIAKKSEAVAFMVRRFLQNAV
jgi:hypothetical protein